MLCLYKICCFSLKLYICSVLAVFFSKEKKKKVKLRILDMKTPYLCIGFESKLIV